MTIKDLTTLRNDIRTAMPDNVAGLIDALDVRETGFIDTIDSLEAAFIAGALDDIAALRSINVAGAPANTLQSIKGHTVPGFGGGAFVLNKSGTIGANKDNNGTIIHANGGPPLTDPQAWYWERVLSDGRIITPQMFGFIDDFDGITGTDNAAAVQAAADALNDLNAAVPTEVQRAYPTLFFPPISNGYYCQETITVQRWINVIMYAPIVHDKDETSVGLIVGTAGENNTRVALDLNVTRKQGDSSDWSDESSVGIRLVNPRACHNIRLHVGSLNGGFTIGCQLQGDVRGSAWNEFHLGQFRNNKIALDLVNIGAGFVNENIFLGGEFVVDSGVQPGVIRHCVRMRSQDGVNMRLNNNYFLRPTFESRTECEPILIINGQGNEFRSLRDETNSGVLARIKGTGMSGANLNFGNIFNMGFGDASSGQIIQEGDAYDNIFQARQQSFNSKASTYSTRRLVFDSGNVGDLAIAYDGSQTHVRDMQVHASTLSQGLIRVSAVKFSEAVEFSTNFGVANDTMNANAHPLVNGDRVYLTNTGGSLPTGLSSTTLYYVTQTTADTFKLSESRTQSPVVTFSDDGTGQHFANVRLGHCEMGTARSIARRVDTTAAKNFSVEKGTRPGFAGRVMCHCYDGNGILLQKDDTFTVDTGTNQLIPDNTHTPVAVGDRITVSNSGGALPAPLQPATIYFVAAVDSGSGRFTLSATEGGVAIDITDAGTGTHTYDQEYGYATGNGFSWTTSFGGHYRQGNDVADDYAFRVRDEVKSITVGISGGSNVVKLQRFKVYTIDEGSSPRTWLDYDAEPGHYYATQAPTFGTYYGTMTIKNYEPGAGLPQGWVLDAAGSPGTWLPMPNL